MEKALVAAMIMLLDPKIHDWLEANDPQVLQLARDTVKELLLGTTINKATV